jgi:hypothetical protein
VPSRTSRTDTRPAPLHFAKMGRDLEALDATLDEIGEIHAQWDDDEDD